MDENLVMHENIKDDYSADLDNMSNNSLVENTLTLDCSLNAFSSDQIGILRDSAKAKYGSSLFSFPCGDILAASCKKSLYSDSGNCLICLSNNLNKYKNSNSSMAENFFILSLSDNNSSNTYFGEKNLQSCFNSSLNICLLVESILKNENNVLASGINSLSNSIFDYKPCRLATFFFNSSVSCLTCSSVNFDLDSIASAMANSMSITRFLNAFSSAVLNSSLNSAGMSNLIDSSAILLDNDGTYINISEKFKLRKVREILIIFERQVIREEISGQISGQMLSNRQKEILGMIQNNPQISRGELSQKLEINSSAVQKHLEKLKMNGILRRIGPAKGGH